MDTWLRDADEWVVFVGLVASLAGAAEIGFRIARHVRGTEGAIAPEASAVQGAVLGLLALLLGFTFSLAMSRFETRKEVIRDEANAIGTTYLRARLLSAPQRGQVEALLRGYVDTRIELQRVSFLPDRLRDVDRRTGVFHAQLWEQAVSAAARDPSSEMTSLFVSALNDTIDMHGVQMAAIRNRVPMAVFLLLFLVSVVALGLTGYACGPDHRQSATLTWVVSLLIAAVILLIFDLHRPARGLIHVDLANITDLKATMQRGSAAAN